MARPPLVLLCHLHIKLSFSGCAPGPEAPLRALHKAQGRAGIILLYSEVLDSLYHNPSLSHFGKRSLNVSTQVLCHWSLWLRPNQDLIPAGWANKSKRLSDKPFPGSTKPLSKSPPVGDTSPEWALPSGGRETWTRPSLSRTFQSPPWKWNSSLDCEI